MTTSNNARGKNFNSEGLKQLAESFLHISQNPITGSGQKKENFWERIAEHYNQNKSKSVDVRTAKSLETKWGEVRRDCSKFKDCYLQVRNLNISGMSAEDMMEKAQELYKQKDEKGKEGKGKEGKGKEGKGKPFAYSECFNVLKRDPRWMDPPDELPSKRRRARSVGDIQKEGSEDMEDKASSPSPIATGDSDPTHDSPGTESTQIDILVRPMGSKAAKAKVKQEKAQEHSHRIIAEAHKKMADVAVERLKVVEYQSLVMLLSEPGFEDAESLALLKATKLHEIARLKKRLSISTEAGLSTLSDGLFSDLPSIVGPTIHGQTSDTSPPVVARVTTDVPIQDAAPITACRISLHLASNQNNDIGLQSARSE